MKKGRIKLVNDANIMGLSPKMRSALVTAGGIYNRFGRDFIITCGLNGNHSFGSAHYYGFAIDTRTFFWTKKVQEKVFKALKRELGYDYLVIWEKDHFHIQLRKWVS
jgi:hypothetical protein